MRQFLQVGDAWGATKYTTELFGAILPQDWIATLVIKTGYPKFLGGNWKADVLKTAELPKMPRVVRPGAFTLALFTMLQIHA